MARWNFYYSGILYSKICEEENGLFIEQLDFCTGDFKEKVPFTSEENKIFWTLCKRDILAFLQKRAMYEAWITEEPDRFVTENQEEYTNRKGTSYIQRHKKFPKDIFYENGQIYAVVMCARDYTAVLVKEGFEDRTILAKWKNVCDESIYAVKFHGTFSVETSDGEALLATDVYLPVGAESMLADGECLEKADGKCLEKVAGALAEVGLAGKAGRVPTVLVRTPYGKGEDVEGYFRFVQRGYAVVIQDTRGREDSTGEWLPNYYEVEDGDDTLNWIAAQDWSDGNVGMTGGSYLGYVQWAAAASGNPHLKAMLSNVTAGSAFGDMPRRGGCFDSGMMAWAFMMTEQRMRQDLMEQDNWDEILDIRPLNTITQKVLGHEVPFLTKWLEHKDMDELWKMSDWKARYKGGPVPALIMSGWFDDNGMGTTEALDLVRDWPEGTWKTILGPWKHSGNADYDIHNVYMGEDALRYDMDIQCMKWLEHFLKGKENGIEKTATVEYYTVGENEWKTAEQWPPKEAVPTIYYLNGAVTGDEMTGAKGDAAEATDASSVKKSLAAGNSVTCGQGLLTLDKPVGSGVDDYIYDPDNPAIHIIDMSENEISVPENYTQEEKRTDVLSYSTQVLTEPITITGDVEVGLYISCDCPDTDFVVRITDVDENGTSIKLAEGIMGAKYRNSFETPEYLEPGEIYEVKVRTSKISNTFKPGHKMRLTVTSSAKNYIFPNSNTKEGFDSEIKKKAHISLWRNEKNASYIKVYEEK